MLDNTIHPKWTTNISLGYITSWKSQVKAVITKRGRTCNYNSSSKQRVAYNDVLSPFYKLHVDTDSHD